jgi:hypothetical protein
MKPLRLLVALAPVACALSLAGSASAQAAAPAPAAPPSPKVEYVEKPKAEDGARPDGASAGLSLGGTLNVVDNRSVVGQAQGTGFAAGWAIDAAVAYNQGEHEWRNGLISSAGATRTPAIDAWVKTRDALSFESIYLWHVLPWLGPFVRVGLDTQMFPGSDPRAAPTTYSIARTDGSKESITGTRLHLSDPFQPLTLKESAGVFVQPLREEKVRLEGRVGAGAQEVFANGVLALGDDAKTPDVVEVKELASFNQAGVEALAEATGTFRPQRITYKAGIGVLFPLAHTALAAGDERTTLQLTNVDIVGALSFKLVDWASLDYQLRLLRQPQLVDAWQVSNNLLLTIGLAVGTKAAKPPPPPPVCTPEPAPAANTPPAPVAPPVAPPVAAPPPPPPPAPAPAAPPAATP